MSETQTMSSPELQSYGEQIDAMQAALDKATRQSNLQPVEVDGRVYGQAELRSKIEAMRTDLLIELAHVRRAQASTFESYITETGELKHRPKGPDPLLLPSNEDLVQLFGYKRYGQLSTEQKAAARSLKASDLDAVDLKAYFGKGSDAKRAQSLAASNPGKYRLLKQKAVEAGLL